MPEISYKDLENHLTKSQGVDQIILVHGDSLLCDDSLQKIISMIFKSKDPGMNYEKADGLSALSIGNAIEFVMTRSFFSGPKVVCISDARIFDAKSDLQSLISKAKQAFDKDDRKKAYKYLIKYINDSGSDLSSLSSTNFSERLNVSAEDEWIWQLIVYARESGVSAEDGQGESAVIEKAIERGLPKNHYLILITDSVDKRKSSYKEFSNKALIINCQIPKGDRKADKDAQSAIFREKANALLAPLNKSLDPLAFASLMDMTGDDLRVFSENLKLLADVASDRQKITKEDVNRVLVRTKQDPIYEFTNSLGSRDLESSLFFMRSILDSGAHPLQILASMVNLIRRLLVIKSFAESQKGRAWRKGMSYNDFQNSVMTEVNASDSELTSIVSSWSSSSKASKKASNTKTDLLIAKGASPYPVYLLFQKASGFIMDELLDYFSDLAKLDLRMKTSAGDAVLLIESVVIKICTSVIKK